MDLFGKKTVSDLQRRYDKAEAARLKAVAALDEEHRRLEARSLDFETLKEKCQGLDDKLAAIEKERDKAIDSLSRAEKMVRWMEEREAEKAEAVRKAEAATEESSRKAVEVKAELDRLQTELDEARRPKTTAPDTPKPPPSKTGPNEEMALLLDENESLRRQRAENSERLRVALRKAEHNRRAYLITQMQLDLAEDRIHILTKGKPRPVHRQNPLPDAAVDEVIVAEDVDGYEETGPSGG